MSAFATCSLRRTGLPLSTTPKTNALPAPSIGGLLGRWRGVTALGAGGGSGQATAVVHATGADRSLFPAAGNGGPLPRNHRQHYHHRCREPNRYAQHPTEGVGVPLQSPRQLKRFWVIHTNHGRTGPLGVRPHPAQREAAFSSDQVYITDSYRCRIHSAEDGTGHQHRKDGWPSPLNHLADSRVRLHRSSLPRGAMGGELATPQTSIHPRTTANRKPEGVGAQPPRTVKGVPCPITPRPSPPYPHRTMQINMGSDSDRLASGRSPTPCKRGD